MSVGRLDPSVYAQLHDFLGLKAPFEVPVTWLSFLILSEVGFPAVHFNHITITWLCPTGYSATAQLGKRGQQHAGVQTARDMEI